MRNVDPHEGEELHTVDEGRCNAHGPLLDPRRAMSRTPHDAMPRPSSRSSAVLTTRLRRSRCVSISPFPIIQWKPFFSFRRGESFPRPALRPVLGSSPHSLILASIRAELGSDPAYMFETPLVLPALGRLSATKEAVFLLEAWPRLPVTWSTAEMAIGRCPSAVLCIPLVVAATTPPHARGGGTPWWR